MKISLHCDPAVSEAEIRITCPAVTEEIKDVLENKLLWDGQRLAVVDPAVGLAVQEVAIERQEQ